MLKNALFTTVAAGALLAGMAVASSSAQAGSISHNYAQTVFGDTSITVPLDLFDSSLGTLDSVVISEALSVSAAAAGHQGLATYVGSTSGSPTTGTPTTTTSLAVSGGPSTLTGAAALSAVLQQFIALDSPVDGGPTSATWTPSSYQSTGVVTLLSGLTDWTLLGGGTDPLSLMFSTLANPLTNIGLGYPDGQGPQIDWTLNVTFNFSGGSTTDTPEPASMLILGAGLFGIGYARRRWRGSDDVVDDDAPLLAS